MNIKKAVFELVNKHGSYRKAAAAVGVSYAQLHKLGSGANKNPTAMTLKRLGLV